MLRLPVGPISRVSTLAAAGSFHRSRCSLRFDSTFPGSTYSRGQFKVVSSFFRTLILAERQLDRAQAVVLLI